MKRWNYEVGVSAWSRLASFATVLMVFAACISQAQAGWRQTPQSALTKSDSKRQAFDVATVKLAGRNESVGIWPRPGSFSARNVPVSALVLFAYHSRSAGESDEGIVKPDQIVGLPRWARTEGYDIEAKALTDVTSLQSAPAEQQKEVNQHRLATLLADRFKLRYHFEIKERPVFELVVKGKPKLSETDTPTLGCAMRMWPGNLYFTGCSIDQLAFNLASESEIDQIVLNKTGLQGNYDLRLSWSEDQQEQMEGGSSLISALQEQLGLSLVSVRRPVSILVVDHMERPTPN